MKRLAFLSSLLLFAAATAGGVLAGPTEEAARHFESGNALLRNADFDGALAAFKTAALANVDSQVYAQQYAMLRQVVRMRHDCPAEKDAERWQQMAVALRTFYHDHGLYAEALPLDRERHKRYASTESAVLLVETQLALGLYAQAAEVLATLPEDLASPRTRLLHGLALAYQADIPQAKKAAKVPWLLKDDLGPDYFYDLARLRVLSGDTRRGIRALTRSFQLTPPSRLEVFKTRVVDRGDFRAVAGTAAFARALKTNSKVKESKCSGGAGCGKCPQRAKCGTAEQAKDAKGQP